jgi:hypothetical protein
VGRIKGFGAPGVAVNVFGGGDTCESMTESRFSDFGSGEPLRSESSDSS